MSSHVCGTVPSNRWAIFDFLFFSLCLTTRIFAITFSLAHLLWWELKLRPFSYVFLQPRQLTSPIGSFYKKQLDDSWMRKWHLIKGRRDLDMRASVMWFFRLRFFLFIHLPSWQMMMMPHYMLVQSAKQLKMAKSKLLICYNICTMDFNNR